MQKPISIILTLVLCLSLIVPAGAAETDLPADTGGYDVVDTTPSAVSDKATAAVGAPASVPTALSEPTPLDSSLMQFTYISSLFCDNPDVVPYDAGKCIYFLSKNGIRRFSPETGEVSGPVSLPSGYIYSRFTAKDKVYYLYRNKKDQRFYIAAFDYAKGQFEEAIQLPDTYIFYNRIGVDAKGRFYLTVSDADKNSLMILMNRELKVLSSVPVTNAIYDFIGFDESNGNFYVYGYMNYVSWGYDHKVYAIYPGNVTNDTLSYPEKHIIMLSQQSYNMRVRQAELYDDRYLVADSTMYRSYSVYREDNFHLSDSSIDRRLSLDRDSNQINSIDMIGTRSAYLGNDRMLVSGNDNVLTEYDLTTGAQISTLQVDLPVFMMMKYRDSVFVIEKKDGQYYYQMITWRNATKLTVSPKRLTLNTGDSAMLSVSVDTPAVPTYTWKTDDPKIASVSSDGQVYAWHGGKTVVTVTASNGLSAQIPITVNDTRDHSEGAYHSTTSDKSILDNRSENNYSYWSKTMKSFIIENADYTLTLVGYNNNKVTLDTYSADGKTFRSRKTIDAELSLFGGCFSGEKYHFLVFGEPNKEESNDKEIMRIVRYDKNWQRNGSVSVYGSNTYYPFDAGSLRMDEYGGKLYVYTCHEMYQTDDGYHHQANMIFVVDEEKCTVKEQYTDVMNIAQTGYVSHSFNQFIKVDGKDVYRVDHGDSGPRGVAVIKSDIDDPITKVEYRVPVQFDNYPKNYNYTGASVGGLELGRNNLIVVGNQDEDLSDKVSSFRIFATAVSKDLSQSDQVWLTDPPESDVTIGTPQLVKIGEDQFLVMWEESRIVNYTRTYIVKMVTIDGRGNKTSDIVSENCRLSDCQPIFCSDGLVRWYTGDSKTTTVHAVDPFRLGDVDEEVLVGDVDLDDEVTIADATRIGRFAAKMCDFDRPTYTGKLTRGMFRRADADLDGEITVMDATRIQGYLAKVINMDGSRIKQ